METKVCSKCQDEKLLCDFQKDKSKKSGYKSQCKLCISNQHRLYRNNNRDEISKKRRKYYLDNLELTKKKDKEYRIKNQDKLKQKQKEKYQNNFLYKLRVNVRRRINFYLKNKNLSSFSIIGCSVDFLKDYIEKKFDTGMSWENYGKSGWHIDHIVPLSSAKNEQEIIKLCHYTNLQPLWWYDNIKKGNKIL
jgi:hypothetical protein